MNSKAACDMRRATYDVTVTGFSLVLLVAEQVTTLDHHLNVARRTSNVALRFLE